MLVLLIAFDSIAKIATAVAGPCCWHMLDMIISCTTRGQLRCICRLEHSFVSLSSDYQYFCPAHAAVRVPLAACITH